MSDCELCWGRWRTFWGVRYGFSYSLQFVVRGISFKKHVVRLTRIVGARKFEL